MGFLVCHDKLNVALLNCILLFRDFVYEYTSRMVNLVYIAVMTVLIWNTEWGLSIKILSSKIQFLHAIFACMKYIGINMENNFITKSNSKWTVT